ncbi:MAG: DUF2304 domain-containing protein [Kiritimatiellaeota bacterium]|nr:DUF2304 domain-containing protein [Kiritimatiellota bacterium]
MIAPIQIFRIVAGVTGAGALACGVWLAVRRGLSASFVALSALFATGVALLGCAVSAGFVRAVLSPSHMGRIRMAVGAIAVFALIATFEAIRHTKLKERYALLWIFPLTAVFILTAFTAPMRFLRDKFGMEYSSTMAAVVFVSLMSAVFVLAKNLSKAERDITTLAQQHALLKEEVRNIRSSEVQKSNPNPK